MEVKTSPINLQIVKEHFNINGNPMPTVSNTYWKLYVLPIVTYGLEIVLQIGKALDIVTQYFKKLLKPLMSLVINNADPTILFSVFYYL